MTQPPAAIEEFNIIGYSAEKQRIPNPCYACGLPACYGDGKRWACTEHHIATFRRASGS